MKTLAILLALSSVVVTDAVAQDDVQDLDADPNARDRSSRRDSLEQEVIREIERGYYLKSNIGSTFYLGNYSATLQAGTLLGFAVGSDFVDNEKNSAAWEVQFSQGVHNGERWEDQIVLGRTPSQNIQGDTRTFLLAANAEYSIYPSRRIGIGIRGGAGIMLSPLLIESSAFQTEVEANWGTTTTVHRNPHPIAFIGPTFEYYTKLSHFSLGADVDASYALGFDLGVSASGYLKYTF